MPTCVAAAFGDASPGDFQHAIDLDLISALADHAAHGALANFQAEDWRRSPLRRVLDAAVGRLISDGRVVPSGVIEALDRMESARR